MEQFGIDDKKAAPVSIVEVDGRYRKIDSTTHIQDPQWHTGLRNRMPWFGFISLFLVILCSIGQMLVLLFSEARSATQWPDIIAPNVCLSLLNSISTLLITFAVGQGIAISWWRRALKGASVKQLHYDWSFGASIASIILKIKYFNAIALAALMTKVAIIDGVLYQRSTGTYIAIDWDAVASGTKGFGDVQAWSREQFPTTGIFAADNSSEGQMTRTFADVVANYLLTGAGGLNGADYIGGCYGLLCAYNLRGSGFSVDCNEEDQLDRFVEQPLQDVSRNNVTIFSIDYSMLYPDHSANYSRIEMIMKYPTAALTNEDTNTAVQCPTRFTVATCEMRPAIMNYTVWYTNSTSLERSKLFDKPKSGKYDNTHIGRSGSMLGSSCTTVAKEHGDTVDGYENGGGCFGYATGKRQMLGVDIIANHDIFEPFESGANSSLVGIYRYLQDLWRAEAVLSYNNGSWSMSQSGVIAPIANNGKFPDNTKTCNYTYRDPTNIAIMQLNTLMLQLSVSRDFVSADEVQLTYNNEAGGLRYNQQVPAQQYYKDIYYSTDYRYMGAALGLTMFVIICILPSYWGFWELGRDVTLGPLEIAYAFQGPAFASVNTYSGDTDEVLRTMGKTRIKYGQVESEPGSRLAFKTT